MKNALHIFIILIMLASGSARAQMPIKLSVADTVPPDSADLAYYGRKHFWRAAAEVAGFNIGLWAFDRYVQKGDFAYISLNTIKENFKHGFIWDNDKLGTNMFLHPYTGNLYYNCARSNGFNYWQSSLFAIGGSAMWELFMESEYPSTNDVIATPIGGTAIGEVAYRASDAIIDDRASGWGRFGRETAAFIVNPMRGLTRIINGDAWRRRATSGKQFGTPNVGMEFSLGMIKPTITKLGPPLISTWNMATDSKCIPQTHMTISSYTPISISFPPSPFSLNCASPGACSRENCLTPARIRI